MSLVEKFSYCDRNPIAPGLDLMPDLPILLRHQARSISMVGLVDSGASVSVLPYSLGAQLGFDWRTQTAKIALGGTLAQVEARGIVVAGEVGKLPAVRLAFAWANTDDVPLLLGEFNSFQVFDIVFRRAQGVFEICHQATVGP